MSDLVGNHIVGFPTRRLKYKRNWHLEATGLEIGSNFYFDECGAFGNK